jgi:hypothetical protein
MQGTHLDSFYELLKEKKELKLADAAKLFNISDQLIFEWARILEAGDLAVLYNPGIGKAVIRLKGEIEAETEEKSGFKNIPEIKDSVKEHNQNILAANELIERENKKKIYAAKELINKLRQKKHSNNYIREMFIKNHWPRELVDSLLG